MRETNEQEEYFLLDYPTSSGFQTTDTLGVNDVLVVMEMQEHINMIKTISNLGKARFNYLIKALANCESAETIEITATLNISI